MAHAKSLNEAKSEKAATEAASHQCKWLGWVVEVVELTETPWGGFEAAR